MVTLFFSLFYIGLFAMASAAVVAAVFYGIALLLTRGVTEGRRGFLWRAALLPFLCVAWFGVVTLAHLSGSLSDDGKDAIALELPNDYAFTAEKGADKGNIADPHGKTRVVDLRRIQVAGERVFGTRFLADEMERLRQLYPKGLSGTHMILDTRTGGEAWLEEKAFEAEVSAIGAVLALRPIAELRKKPSSGPSDWMALALAFGVPLVGLALLVRRGIRLRRSAGARAPQPA